MIGMVLSVAVAQADVFNMGGTRNPTTGTWTGLASLEFVTVGNPGNAADNEYRNCGTSATSIESASLNLLPVNTANF